MVRILKFFANSEHVRTQAAFRNKRLHDLFFILSCLNGKGSPEAVFDVLPMIAKNVDVQLTGCAYLQHLKAAALKQNLN